MSDLISRQDVLDAVNDCGICIQRILDIPSVEPERENGEWKPDESGNVYWICSICGFASEAFGADILYHFCPNCGSKMTRGEDEKA